MSFNSPIKFYPYYRIAFLVNGTNKESSYFSFPEDLTDPSAFSNIATNIDITKSFQGLLGSCNIRLFNLSDNHRNMLFHEPYWVSELEKTGSYKRLILSYGYLSYNGSEKHVDWVGIIRSASSYKQGSSIVTEIIADEMGYVDDNAFIQLELKKGSSIKQIFQKDFNKFIKEAKYTKEIQKEAEKKIGMDLSQFFPERNLNFKCDFKNDYVIEKDKVINTTIEGAISYLLSYITNSRMTKEGNTIYLTDTQKKTENTIIINAENGLQSTPRVYGARMTLNMLFEPKININQTVKVESLIAPNINDEYTVAGYSHHLTLGDGTSPSATTELNLIKIDIEE